MTLLKVKKG